MTQLHVDPNSTICYLIYMLIFIDENDEGKRLDSFLAEVTPDMSRSKIQNLIKSGAVKINDEI